MSEHPRIVYAQEPALGAAEFRQVLIESGLGAIRPITDEARLGRMLASASLIMTAREGGSGGRLLGVARGVTDFSWCCYLSELAVVVSAQKLGVGQALMHETRQLLGPDVAIFLASVPGAVGFYERAGGTRLADAFWFQRER